MRAHSELDAATAFDCLGYEPTTGQFVWLVRRGCAVPGAIAGGLSVYGYVVIKINGRAYFAHRLAWLFERGEWPASEIDHINGVRSDNRICNLRLATHSQNGANAWRSIRNTSGHKGVRYDARLKKRKWTARIVVNRKEIYLGSFADAESARAAYRAAAEKSFGNFAKS